MPIRLPASTFANRATLFRLPATRGFSQLSTPKLRFLSGLRRQIPTATTVGSFIKPHQQARAYAGGPPSSGNEQDMLPIGQYHRLADGTLDNMLEALEEWAEENTEVKDLEFSNSVLTLVVPRGTYVINKQPPNRQIWLSSPISGPARFDYEAETGTWVNLRNGVSLEAVMKEELGVEWEPVEL